MAGIKALHLAAAAVASIAGLGMEVATGIEAVTPRSSAAVAVIAGRAGCDGGGIGGRDLDQRARQACGPGSSPWRLAGRVASSPRSASTWRAACTGSPADDQAKD